MSGPEPFIATLYEWMEVFMRRSIRDLILYSKVSGLSISQIRTLFQIRHKGATISDIGDELGVTNAATSQLLDRLVQDGQIVRSEDPLDRRFKHIALTKKGQCTLEEIIRSRQSWLKDLSALLTDEELEQATAALYTLIAKARQLEQSPNPTTPIKEQS